MPTVIKVENLAKKYILKHQRQEKYITLRDVLADSIRGGVNRLFRPSASQSIQDNPLREELWALKDVSFEVNQGDRIGIIGRNGAGKTTLLKLLSRITEPTAGRIWLRGRVASLLEVGTGFHPELTGRENIYLNGAILGMSKAEIKQKFNEIVDFAEMEKFLDTPVKRYSSGMFVRLAFAVAAHLEPEILLVDEVLAVGDASFQKKCLGKMEKVSREEGRTVLFVSHNMQAIKTLCNDAFLLSKGMLVAVGPATKITELYLRDSVQARTLDELGRAIKELPPDLDFRLERINITQEGHPAEIVSNGLPLEIEIEYYVLQKTTGLRVYFDICDTEGALLFRSFHDENADGIPTVEPGHYVSKAVVPADIFGPITYELKIQASIFNVRSVIPHDRVSIALPVEATGRFNRAYLGDTFRQKLALVIPWETKKI